MENEVLKTERAPAYIQFEEAVKNAASIRATDMAEILNACMPPERVEAMVAHLAYLQSKHTQQD